jgi:hypothetical protein
MMTSDNQSPDLQVGQLAYALQHRTVKLKNECGRTVSRFTSRFARRTAQSQQPEPEWRAPDTGHRHQLGSACQLRMLRSADARGTLGHRSNDAMPTLQSTKHRLKARPNSKGTPQMVRGSSLERVGELSSAGTPQLPAVESRNTSSRKGQTTGMRELVQIDSTTEHTCGQPSIERWQVLEPVSGRWSWVRVFGCCNQVAFEPVADQQQQQQDKSTRIKRAA